MAGGGGGFPGLDPLEVAFSALRAHEELRSAAARRACDVERQRRHRSRDVGR